MKLRLPQPHVPSCKMTISISLHLQKEPSVCHFESVSRQRSPYSNLPARCVISSRCPLSSRARYMVSQAGNLPSSEPLLVGGVPCAPRSNRQGQHASTLADYPAIMLLFKEK